VIVEMRLDPNCPEMTFVDNLSDVKSFGKEADYIYASVDDYRKVNKQVLFLSIEHINGNEVVLSKNGLTSSTKEAAHKLCYIIHQEKITRR
jgi:hypothetical protein